MATLAQCQKAVTYLAENSGVIAALTQQDIESGDPDYILNSIPQAQYKLEGENNRYVRFRTTPPLESAYVPFLPSGNTSYNIANPETGVVGAVTGDKTGRGCSIPAERMEYGYDVKTSTPVAAAIEAGPWCIMDLLRKQAFRPMLERIWKDMPRYGKERFGRNLVRDVIENSYYKFVVADGWPRSTGTNYFPAVPGGGPSYGHMRQISDLMIAEGYQGQMSNGRNTIEVAMSREAIEWMIADDKRLNDYKIETGVTTDDKTWGTSVTYKGIKFVERKFPTRGYLRQTGPSAYEFVEVLPHRVVTAGGEGFWKIPNDAYYQQSVTDGGAQYRMIEIATVIGKGAAVRESLGGIPNVPGKTFNRSFDFTVNPIPDWELAARGCNKDQFYFGYRMLHAYAFRPVNPEQMCVIAYLAPKVRREVVDPWMDLTTPTLAPVTLAPQIQPPATSCEACTTPETVTRSAVVSTPEDLFPTNGPGVIKMAASALTTNEDTPGYVDITVNRVGGSTGAASVVLTLTEGTATNPENFTTPSGFAGTGPWTKTLNWADGAFGSVTTRVPIVAAVGDDDGKVFTASIGTVTTAVLGSVTTTTVTIVDPNEAA